MPRSSSSIWALLSATMRVTSSIVTAPAAWASASRSRASSGSTASLMPRLNSARRSSTASSQIWCTSAVGAFPAVSSHSWSTALRSERRSASTSEPAVPPPLPIAAAGLASSAGPVRSGAVSLRQPGATSRPVKTEEWWLSENAEPSSARATTVGNAFPPASLEV